MSTDATDPATNHNLSTSVTSERESALDPTSKKEITIVLIGETGAGKTTFMSLLVNLFMGHNEFELEERHVPERQVAEDDKSQSQTDNATLYSVRALDGTIIRILDTPGLADTRGIDQDEKHKAKIIAAIHDHVTTLDAVIIMTNGTMQRLGVATDYTLNVITAMFPHSILDNIGIIYTHTDPMTFNFQKDSLQPELRDSPYWLMQNPLSYLRNYRRLQDQGAHWYLLARGRRNLYQYYEDAVDTLNDWLKWLDARVIQRSNAINELYLMSKRIETEIERTLKDATRMQDEKTKWERMSQDLENNEKAKATLDKLKGVHATPFQSVQTEEAQLKVAKELAQKELDRIKSAIHTAPDTIRPLLDQYNSMALSRNYVGHIQSAISMLEYRKKDLLSKPNTELNVEIIDGSISKLLEKLRLVAAREESSS